MPPLNSSSLAVGLITGLTTLALALDANGATVMTSATGNVTTGGAPLGQDDRVSIGDTIEVDGNGSASVLVGDSAIVHMCHGATLGFGGDSGDGPSALNLRGGQLKVSAEKRASDNPLEIHTPVAIATLLGTEVHVTVDRRSGQTVITSIDHTIRVTGSAQDPNDAVVISAGEQIAISAAGEAGPVQQVDRASLEGSSDCLDGSRYRIAAVKTAVRQYADKSIDEIAMMDSEVDVAHVALGRPVIPAGVLGPQPFVQPCLAGAQCSGITPSGPLTVTPSVPTGVPSGP